VQRPFLIGNKLRIGYDLGVWGFVMKRRVVMAWHSHRKSTTRVFDINYKI